MKAPLCAAESRSVSGIFLHAPPVPPSLSTEPICPLAHPHLFISLPQVSAASLVPRMFAGQVSSITYALARCSSLMPGGTAANTTTQHLLDTMLARVTKDQGRLLWQGAHGPAIKNLLHGIARLGYSPSSSTSSRSAAAAASQATQQLCRIIAQDPSRLHVRELATAAWSLARISRNRPGLLDAPSTAAALDAISGEVVARKLYLRPPSMTGLLIALAWLKRRDEALLAAVAEVRLSCMLGPLSCDYYDTTIEAAGSKPWSNGQGAPEPMSIA